MCYRLAVRKDRNTFWLAWLLITVGVSSPAYSEPFIPPQDEHVLERVVRGTRFNQGALLKTAKLEEAIALAREYIELSRHSGDPRFNGRAEALLAPWSEQRPVPSVVLLLRATVRQHRHDFDAALEDLERVIAMEPRNAQALLTHATINQVVGDYTAARSSCLRLHGIASDLTTVACPWRNANYLLNTET